jgi:hypothetical protein
MRSDCRESTVQLGSRFQTEESCCLGDVTRADSCSAVALKQHWALEGNTRLDSQPEG